MERTLGLPEARSPQGLLEGFDPASLPRLPTRYAGI
jgi:hypothetical protein